MSSISGTCSHRSISLELNEYFISITRSHFSRRQVGCAMEVNKKEKNQVCPYNFKEAVIAEKKQDTGFVFVRSSLYIVT